MTEGDSPLDDDAWLDVPPLPQLMAKYVDSWPNWTYLKMDQRTFINGVLVGAGLVAWCKQQPNGSTIDLAAALPPLQTRIIERVAQLRETAGGQPTPRCPECGVGWMVYRDPERSREEFSCGHAIMWTRED